MLHIRFSNRFEILRDALLERVLADAPGPFDAVEILVPGTALRRQIELAMADRFGICANLRFAFLAQWLWAQIGKLVEVGGDSPFDARPLTWRLYQLLGEPALLAAHPRLAAYLQRADPVMRLELAQRCAALFDQYATYRPDWIEQWLHGDAFAMPGASAAQQQDQHWQMALWRRIAADLGVQRQHPALAFSERLATLDDSALQAAGLPPRIHVFCPPSIPPLYLDLLRRLGARIEVELYVLNPCREYWFEIVDQRRLSYLASRQQDLYHEVGNRLLAGWGAQTQSFLELLLDDGAQATLEHSRFQAPAQNTLLGEVQRAVLELRELEPGSITLKPDDRSIEVHVCHTLTRELEVLHDQLLAQFAAADPAHPLRPSEVLVVTPDLEQAAPLIDAVFGSVPPARRIPYAITGRPASSINPVAAALLDLLALAASRHAVGAVFGLLQQPLVAQRFGIGIDDLDTIRDWLVEAGIHWGIDAAHRAQFGLPPTARHSFDDGLQRLFLGYALPSAAPQPFNGRVAAGAPEGSAAGALGSLYQFFHQLQGLQRQLALPQTAGGWTGTLLAMLDAFIDDGPEQIDDRRDVQRAITQLGADLQAGGLNSGISPGPDQQLPAAVIRHALQGLLDQPTSGAAPSGSVTFAAMSSLRNLPYRVICVIGMADGAFPVPNRPAEFDLMPLAARRGDRQRRNEERNLFLDLLLAARERFYLSYTGKSVRDNTSLPPSVLVSDLLDVLVPAIAAAPPQRAGLRAAQERLVLEHPLQAFSASYFSGDADRRRISFNDDYCQALQQQRLAVPSATPPAKPEADPSAAGDDGNDSDEEAAAGPALPPFFSAPLAAPGPEWRIVSMDQLQEFFRNPSRYLLRRRLGISMADRVIELADDEPVLPEFLHQQAFAEHLLPHLLNDEPEGALRALAAAGLEFPSGPLGAIGLNAELEQLRPFAARLRQKTAAPCLPPISRNFEFDLDGEKWQLQGAIGDLRANGLVRYRYDDTRPIDRLLGWLDHLFLNAATEGVADGAAGGATAVTHWLSRDGEFRFEPVADASAQLQQLLRLYRRGLSRPLPFFPKSAWEYIDNSENIRAALNRWTTSMYRQHGEDSDPAYRLALRGNPDPLDGEFETVARLVYLPLLQSMNDPRR